MTVADRPVAATERTGGMGFEWMAVQDGRFAKLRVDGQLVMSDTHMECRTNHAALRDTHGHVLIGGLGLAMLPRAMLLGNPAVDRVTILEDMARLSRRYSPYLDRGCSRGYFLGHWTADILRRRRRREQRSSGYFKW